ncbi:MAG: site-specific integrase, partial [Paramuribaculum sp.]|nr:site-specific integrase [Paramuribaculum sp.]
MIEEFLRYITAELQLSPQTVDAYRTDLNQWSDFATSGGAYDLRPETTTLSDLRLWIAQVARQGASPRTIRRKIQSLRAFFRFMMRLHGLADNPAMELTVPKTPRNLPVYVRTEEMSQMLDSEIDEKDFDQVRNRLILDMFYT